MHLLKHLIGASLIRVMNECGFLVSLLDRGFLSCSLDLKDVVVVSIELFIHIYIIIYLISISYI